MKKPVTAKKRTASPRAPRRRAASSTRAAILHAAVVEFAREGYGGARVDRISKAAKSNDRMLYYYFASKENLFQQVVQHCYAELVAREEALALDFSQPRKALAEIVSFNWNYYWDRPEILSILASENRVKAIHVKNNIPGVFANTQLKMLDRIVANGLACGDFTKDCDRVFLFMSILSLTYFYRANLYTASNYLQIDLSAKELKDGWLRHIQAMIEALLR